MSTKTPFYLKNHAALYARDPHAAAQQDLLDTGPLADGSIHPEDASTFAEAGRRIRARPHRLRWCMKALARSTRGCLT